MPTAARLFAAIGFAAVMFFATSLFIPVLPEGTQTGKLLPVNLVITVITAWLVMGRFAGKGYYRAVGTGMRTVATALFFILILWSLTEMLSRSMRKLYDGPMHAITSMFELMAEYAQMIVVDPQVPLMLVVGSLLAAFFSEWAAARFR